MPKLLLVDCDDSFLADARTAIRRNTYGWEVFESTSAADALAIIDREPIDLVISNLDLNGPDECQQLLRTIAERAPAANRIITTGKEQKSAVIQNLRVANSVNMHSNMEDLTNAAVRFYALRRHLASPNLREIVQRIHELPVLPDRYQKLESILSREDYRQDELTRVVGEDPAVVAQILRVGNSVMYARRTPIATLEQAITLLGTTTIRTIVLSSELFRSISPRIVREFGLEALWEHSLRVGKYSQFMARKAVLPAEVSDQAFSAGLLHDIGKLVLVQCFPDQYRKALKLRADEQIPLDEAEEEIFQAHHGEIGAYLLGVWNMPDPLLEAALYHHHPMACQCKDISVLGLVCAANAVDHARFGEFEGGLSSGEFEEYLFESGSQDILEAWQEITETDE